ncbi:MAG TPA: lipid-A-disaccharide synthase, partial [Paracoccaceae bacterium]|nr:lipid-A-disaccharide synthase [Paracoccaceae bacterium]
RRGEVKRLGLVFRDVCAKLEAGNNPPKIVIPAVPHLAEVVAETFRDIPHEIVLPDTKSSDPNAEKRLVFAAADAALAASGTVSLELAAAGTPMVIAYDFNWLTRFIVRRMVKLNSATLVNILTNTNAVPEFIFEDCAAEKILPCLQTTLQDPRSSQAQLAAATEAMKMLGQGGEDPGLRAARSVLDFIKQ